MRNCPDCTEENFLNTLFCAHCGRCLLAPDPEEVRRPKPAYTQLHNTVEGIDFIADDMVKKSMTANLMQERRTAPFVIEGWLLLLNLLVLIAAFEIVRYILAD